MKPGAGKRGYALLLLFSVAAVLVFIKSRCEERNLAGLDGSFTEIVNDRLVVESYIYRLNDLVYRKKFLAVTDVKGKATKPAGQALDTEIGNLIAAYAATKLTRQEKLRFEDLRARFRHLRLRETKGAAVQGDYDAVLATLRSLSDIQLAEGRQLMDSGHATVSASLLGIKLGWALYAVLLICVVRLFRERILFSAGLAAHRLN